MDKAEKLKAARKKLKEFQTHKQEPQGGSFAHDSPDVATAQEDVTAPLVPSTEEGLTKQTLMDTFASSGPQIASFFDGVSGFDISQQQITESPQQQQVYSASPNFIAAPPQHFQQDVSQPFATQQFAAPAPFAMAYPFEHVQQNSAPYQSAMNGLQTQLDQANHQITQLRSELEFHRMTATNLQKNTDELIKLRQETQSHVDVVKVLVSEKSNLLDSLHKSELTIKSKTEENDELQNRLNVSRHRVKQLENEMKSSSNKSSFDPAAEAIKIEEIVAVKIKEFQESNERFEMEKNELKVLLNQKKIEMENLQKNFDHLSTELHLANVKIAQLSDGTAPTEIIDQSQLSVLSQDVAIKQQQIAELYSVIDQVNRDKEASDNQYQNYVSHLTREMETLKENSLELSNENDALVRREQELLKHTADLERQIQQQIQKQKTYAEDQRDQTSSPSQEEVQKLTSQIAALTESNESLKSQLGKIEAEKNELGQNLLLKLEEMKNMELQVERLMTETPNLSRLMTDFEDKSVAASRALSQNQGLKEQLDEMQRAFITMTNDKMELTDRLQSELHLCKEMKIRYDAMEVELTEMKDKWHYKEDEMIRLSHENTELEKKIMKQNIEIDRLRHYESKEYHGSEGILERELENSKRLIETLTNKINILETNGSHQHDHHHDESGHSHGHSHSADHNHSHSPGHNHQHHEHEYKDHKCETDNSAKQLLEEIEMLKMEKSELLKAMHDFQMNKKNVEKAEESDSVLNGIESAAEMNEEAMQKLTIPNSVTPSMATEEALEKLQSRFRRTMLEVAELTEEKQRLEHVVTQLQFETETIGEYITLYQYQRRLLKQKEHERDIQLKNLSSDREKINKKLLQLNGLIEKFVMQSTDNVELAREATKFLDNTKDPEPDHPHPLIIQPDHQKLKYETAGKILEILSDIKTANSISYDQNVCVEHCSCCLGKLETV